MKKKKKRLALVKTAIAHFESNNCSKPGNQPGADLTHTCPASFTCTCTAAGQCGPSFTCPPNC